MNAKLKDATGQDDYEMSAEAERRVVANSSLAKKLQSLESMVSSKDSELQLLKDQCADLQALLKQAENPSECDVETGAPPDHGPTPVRVTESDTEWVSSPEVA